MDFLLCICDDMEKFENQLTAIENRKAVCSYFMPNSTLSGYNLNGLVVSSFDDQILEHFWFTFTRAANAQKREAAIVILNLSYKNSHYTSKEEISKTISNFGELTTRLSNYREYQTDCITIAIIIETCKEIAKLVTELKSSLQTIDQ